MISVVWKMSEMMRRVSSPRLLKMFRLMHGSEKLGFDASSGADPSEDRKPPEIFNSQAHIIANQRMHEIEAQKAMIVARAQSQW